MSCSGWDTPSRRSQRACAVVAGRPRHQAQNAKQPDHQRRIPLLRRQQEQRGQEIAGRTGQRDQRVRRRGHLSLDPDTDAGRTQTRERLRPVAEPARGCPVRRLMDQHRSDVEGESGTDCHALSDPPWGLCVGRSLIYATVPSGLGLPVGQPSICVALTNQC